MKECCTRWWRVFLGGVAAGLALLVGVPGAQPAAPDTVRLNLRQCLQRAMSANLDIRESELERMRALADQFEADMSRWLPIFEIRGFSSVVKDAEGRIEEDIPSSWRHFGPYWEIKGQLAQPITTFGRISALRRAARYGVEASEAGIEVRRAKVAGEVYRLYYGVLLARELLRILDDVSEKLDMARRKVRTLLDEGSAKVTTVDLTKIEVYGFEIERKRIEAQKNIRLALGALRRALNIPYDTPFEIEDGRLRPPPERIPPLDSLITAALAHRPEIHQVEAGLEARRLQLAAAEAERWPTLFFGMDFSFRYAPGRKLVTDNPFVGDAYNGRSVRAAFGFQYTLGLSEREARIRRARVAYQEMLRKRAWARESIALEVQKAYEEAVEARYNSRLGRRSLRAGRAWLIQTIERYDLGIADTGDLIEAYGAYAKSQNDYYQTLYDYYLALAELYRTIGRPIWEINQLTNPSQ